MLQVPLEEVPRVGGGTDVDRLARRYEGGFLAGLELTVGLEEELLLLEPLTLLPANGIELALDAVQFEAGFRAELRASQLELVTPICLTVGDAGRALVAARRRVVRMLGGRLRLAAVGTHPLSALPSAISPLPRYQEIARECAWATRRGQPCGLHVHVGLADPHEALQVYNAARSYLPELAALAANSPFFEGRDSGLASCRLKLSEDWPRSGVPPVFGDWRRLAEFTIWGQRSGSFEDPTYLLWDLRLRPDYGTLEFRIADVQTRPEDNAAVAAVCQALVATLLSRLRAGEQLAVHETHWINENRWRALRDGLEGELAELSTGYPQPTRDRLAELLDELAAAAGELGCATELGQGWKMLEQNGASRQRRLARHVGLAPMPLWLANETERLDRMPARETGMACELESLTRSSLAPA